MLLLVTHINDLRPIKFGVAILIIFSKKFGGACPLPSHRSFTALGLAIDRPTSNIDATGLNSIILVDPVLPRVSGESVKTGGPKTFTNSKSKSIQYFDKKVRRECQRPHQYHLQNHTWLSQYKVFELW